MLGLVSQKNKQNGGFCTVCPIAHACTLGVFGCNLLSHVYCLFVFIFVGMYEFAISFLGYGITRKQETEELG